MRYGFVIDNRKCIGCHACTVACKAEHETPIGVNRTWVKYIEKGVFPNTRRHFSVMRCNHCADAPCVTICPVTALYHRADGIVDFDNRRCIGCKACTQACPYDALHIDPDSHTAAKCNYCAHRVDVGLEPACVNVCPEQAIVSGDLDDPASAISRLVAREQVTARKPEKGTRPQLFYIDGDRVSLEPSRADPGADYMWSSQARGVGHFARFAEQRRAAADSSALTDQLGKGAAWLDDADEDCERVLVPDGEDRRLVRKAREVVTETARRVYDAPAKGTLWGWEVAAYMWTKSMAAGLAVVPAAAWLAGGPALDPDLQVTAAAASLLLLAITGGLLVLDLDRPDRFLYVLLRPQWRSWLVRGAYIIALFGVLLLLWVAAASGLLAPGGALFWGALLTAGVLAAVYTAFLFAQARGRDFWQSPALALHMLVDAVLAGAAALAVFHSFLPLSAGWVELTRTVLLVGLAAHLLTLLVELTMPHATDDARRAAHEISRGRFRRMFWGGGVAVGGLLPLALLVSTGTALLVPAAALILLGVLVVEYVWVQAPQTIPLS